jgi:hypothetical protein
VQGRGCAAWLVVGTDCEKGPVTKAPTEMQAVVLQGHAELAMMQTTRVPVPDTGPSDVPVAVAAEHPPRDEAVVRQCSRIQRSALFGAPAMRVRSPAVRHPPHRSGQRSAPLDS